MNKINDNSNKNIRHALQTLEHKVVVAAEIKSMDIFKEYGIKIWAADIESVRKWEGEEYNEAVKIDEKFRPILENALNDKYPSQEEFGIKLEWYGYPLEGLIIHRLGNLKLNLEMKDIRKFLPEGTPYREWTKDPKYIPYVEKGSDARLQQKLQRLQKSQSP